MPPFALTAECLSAGTATPGAERRDRRFAAAWSVTVLAAGVLVSLLAGFPFFIVGAAVSVFLAWLLHRRLTATHRRRHDLWTSPPPPGAVAFLEKKIPHFRCLDADGRELFLQRFKVFLESVAFHGAGVEVDDGLRWRAAAAAVTPTLGFPEWDWTGLREIIFRPEGYDGGSYEGEDGLITEFEESGMVGNSGVLSGVMMLSSEDLIWEFAHPEEGGNVGFHEFAHLMAGGDGVLLAEEDREGWEALVRREGKRIRRDDSLLDEYALLNDVEFYAVASELFFTVPRLFRAWHRELYAVLARSFRQDPAEWLEDCHPDAPGRRRRRRGGGGGFEDHRTGKTHHSRLR